MAKQTTDEYAISEQTKINMERAQVNGDAHKEISMLIMYPPFTLYRDKIDQLVAMLEKLDQEASVQIMKTDQYPENLYAPVMEKFKDDLDMARLYQKRYGDDWRSAQAAAMKVDELSEDYPGLYVQDY
jgi:hypothetical protein